MSNRFVGLGRASLALFLVFCAPHPTQAQIPEPPPPLDLSNASLEQLMNIEVTSVSKKGQRLSRVAAAIFVINQEEIRRSGATNIPDLLRMVPGMDVAQIRSHDWAISARGFNSVFANKLLVLIDGRSVYNPAYSGVLWFTQDVPLATIERIEVIRGPGATVWGANAVNGVINIITKSAKATHGVLVEAGAGSQLAAQGLVQQGGAIGKNGDYRVFVSYSGVDSLLDATGREAADAWHTKHAGFRTDWTLSDRDTLTVQGDISSTLGGETFSGFQSYSPPFQGVYNSPVTSEGGNLLGRWKHVFSPKSETTFQMYFDRLDALEYTVKGTLNTVDLDFQHHLVLGSRHDLVWGAAIRTVQDNYIASPSTWFSPARDSRMLASAFAQDEIRLTDSLWFTIGTKLEHNVRTGESLQPSARLLWSPDDRHTLWGAVSRAIRQPSRTDWDFSENLLAIPSPDGTPAVMRITGNPSYRAEDLRAYELGYRFVPGKRLSLDIATFFNQYRHLKSVAQGIPYVEFDPLPVHVIIPQIFENKVAGDSHGAEVSTTWNVTSSWKLGTGFAWDRMHLRFDRSSLDASGAANGDAPAHQFQARSYYTWSRNLDFDVSLYAVGRLVDQAIPGYVRLDARLARRFGERTELSIIGQNLLNDHHFEYGQTFETALAAQARRSVYAKVVWRY